MALSDQLAAAEPVRLHLLGVALLQLFIQVNWAGVPVASEPAQLLAPLAGNLMADSADILVMDGDSVNPLAQHPILLAAAKLILVDQRPPQLAASVRRQLSLIWSMRCCLTIQAVLEEKSNQLHSFLAALAAAGEDAPSDSEEDKLLTALFLLETARFHSVYYEVREMMRATEEAALCVGLTVRDTGALGRRTRHQVKKNCPPAPPNIAS
jgi:hypothetical protein